MIENAQSMLTKSAARYTLKAHNCAGTAQDVERKCVFYFQRGNKG